MGIIKGEREKNIITKEDLAFCFATKGKI